MLTRYRSPERGFTLIELVVGMTLSTIVLALIVGLVINMFQSGERSSANAKAQKAATAATDLLTNDLRAALAPERTAALMRSDEMLKQLLKAQENPENLLVHDIVYASPNQLVFFADVHASRGETSARAECVRWVRNADTDGAVYREVRFIRQNSNTPAVRRQLYANCAGSAGKADISSRVIPPFSDDGQETPATSLFSYLVLEPTAQGCRSAIAPDPSQKTGAARVWRQDQIVGVRLTASSLVQQSGTRGAQELETSIAIPSRTGSQYRYAIGCQFA